MISLPAMVLLIMRERDPRQDTTGIPPDCHSLYALARHEHPAVREAYSEACRFIRDALASGEIPCTCVEAWRLRSITREELQIYFPDFRANSMECRGLWPLKEVRVCEKTTLARLAALAIPGKDNRAGEPQLKSRTAPDRARAHRAIGLLYPDGVPNQTDKPHDILCQEVLEELRKTPDKQPSRDTILRAAGRRN